MLKLFIFTLIIMCKAKATFPENEIRLIYSHDTNEEFIVWKDKPLRIVIENAYARYIWCFDNYNIQPGEKPSKEFVPETEFVNYEIVNVLLIPKVTAEMNTRWACTVLQDYHSSVPYTYKNRKYTAKVLHFHLYLKGARQVILSANDHRLTYDVTTNQSVQYEYYGSANYTYIDGEDIDFFCKKELKETRPSDNLRLEYFNAEGLLLFQTKSRTQPHKFRSVLKSTNDKYYLDCICASKNPVREYRYRTTFFKKRDTEEHAIMVSINGQNLTTISNKDLSVDHYIFKYIDGEILNVTCLKTDFFAKGAIYFSFDPSLTYRIGPRSSDIISVKILASDINKKTVSCSTKTTDAQKTIATILFLSDVPEHDVFVRGLPRNNILYQYTNDLNQWTIEYQYSVNDTLSLTCVSKSSQIDSNERMHLRNVPTFVWFVKDYTIESTENLEQDLSNTKFSKEITKNLDKTYNGTKIKCIYYPQGTYNHIANKTVEIVLQLKPESVSKAKSDKVNSGKTYSSSNQDILKYCLVSATVMVVIIIVVALYFVVKKRCCVKSKPVLQNQIVAPRPHPDTVFYENLLSVFRPINEREAAEMENHYEEIE